jgi:hypothetical protein
MAGSSEAAKPSPRSEDRVLKMLDAVLSDVEAFMRLTGSYVQSAREGLGSADIQACEMQHANMGAAFNAIAAIREAHVRAAEKGFNDRTLQGIETAMTSSYAQMMAERKAKA